MKRLLVVSLLVGTTLVACGEDAAEETTGPTGDGWQPPIRSASMRHRVTPCHR